MKNIIQDILQNRNSRLKGIYSACTANELVIESVIERSKQTNTPALIEATANQVNQYGGYTGMTPLKYAEFVLEIAKKVKLPPNLLILGGDHLGPLTWSNLDEDQAMKNSDELIYQYVKAGFTKLHIDTSMRIGNDDMGNRLSDEVIAKRTIRLIKIAEESYQSLKKLEPDATELVYVIGSEVPIPGGSQEDDEVMVTSVNDFESTYRTFKNHFEIAGLQAAWNRVVAVVVQPGVEFGDSTVHEYNREAANELTSSLTKYPAIVFEGHSTDYQTKYKLKEMVEDGIAILKVGPALTFALREAIFSLSFIENELLCDSGVILSKIPEMFEKIMIQNPVNWEKHYHGDKFALKFKRKYSFSDRCRYYLPEKDIIDAQNLMLSNLNNTQIPLSILSQYMPVQYTNVREGRVQLLARELIKDRIKNCIDEYLYAIN